MRNKVRNFVYWSVAGVCFFPLVVVLYTFQCVSEKTLEWIKEMIGAWKEVCFPTDPTNNEARDQVIRASSIMEYNKFGKSSLERLRDACEDIICDVNSEIANRYD